MLFTIGLLVSVWFMSDTCFIRRIPWFICWFISSLFHCAVNVHGRVNIYCIRSVDNDSTRNMCERGGEGEVMHVEKKNRGCARKIIMSPYPGSQCVYRYRKGLGKQDIRIVWEYNIVTATEIPPLTQPHTCERGSLGFFAMGLHKCLSTTRAYLSSKLYNERTKG